MRMLLPPYIVHHIALIIYLMLEEMHRDLEHEMNLANMAFDPELALKLTENLEK